MPKQEKYIWLVIVLLSGWASIQLWEYLSSRTITLIGFTALPLLVRINRTQTSLRLVIPAILVAITTLFSPAKTLQFLSVVLFILALIESQIGKTNPLTIVAVGILSPLFVYVNNIFSFPIRLELSKLAANTLNIIAPAKEVGNGIWFNNKLHYIDEACMGLNLTSTALIVSLLVAAYFENQKKARFPFFQVLLITACFFAFNLLANYLRILTLVYFDFPPEHSMHHPLGLISLFIYAIIPGTAFTFWLAQYLKPIPENHNQDVKKICYSGLMISLLTITVLALPFFKEPKNRQETMPTHILPSSLSNKKLTALDHQVWKLKTETGLTYLKNLGCFYSTEHHPLICWKGSGYKLKNIELIDDQNATFYKGILQRGENVLHTAWWYSNGISKTHKQLEWRYNMFRGQPTYYLININANTHSDLISKVKKWQMDSSNSISENIILND